jgi:hypothetical protein
LVGERNRASDMSKPALPLAIICALFTTLSGCAVRSETELIGRYRLGSVEQGIVLDIRPDHTFAETITVGGARLPQHTGTWFLAGSSADFDPLWIPKEFAPEYIVQADANAARGEAKFTQPGNWTMSPERYWGRTSLEVFPDEGVSFRMVGR